MKKKKRSESLSIQPIRCAYQDDAEESIVGVYEKYTADPCGKVEIGGLMFYRILRLDLFIRGERQEYSAVIDREMNLQGGDILIDENENRFTVTSLPMIRSVRNDNMDWNWNTTQVLFAGESAEVGEYLAKLPAVRE